jgi:hypothetical protein
MSIRLRDFEPTQMNPRHAAALALEGWYLMVPMKSLRMKTAPHTGVAI